MSKLNLTNLETVCCIGRLGSFAAAARRLNASQPAITARVRELEQSLGFSFFQRRGRRMELTIEGRLFVDRVDPLIGQLDEAVRQHAQASAMQGVIRIGIGVMTLTWFPEVMARLKRDMPQVHYDVDVDMGMNMLEKLESGALDIAVVAGKVRRARMTTLDLTPVEMQWMMSSAVPREAEGRALATGEILDSAPLWFFSRASDFFPRAVTSLRRHGAHLRNVHTCANTAGMIEMIAHTDGIGLVPTVMAADKIRAGVLVPVSAELAPESSPMTLVCHADQRQTMVRHIMARIVEFDLAIGQSRAVIEAQLRPDASGQRRAAAA